ncbi:RNA polymerase sigma factor [Thalassobacillus hwangdonensis]|uniref:RNA polymerase sigma factor n=1 Tax=Thalassobacillus hwangdonensis TaxID=546108 RepID=A0ABW3L1C8_9BACI
MNDDQLEEWYRLYSQDVYNFLVYYNKSTDVDDLLQDVFVKAWKRKETFKYDSSPKTWLFTIARRVSLDYHRKNKWKQWMTFQKEPVDSSDPARRMMVEERNTQLYKQINRLKRNYREVILLRGVMELSTEETAKILHCTHSKVDTTFYRAKKKLRQYLEAEGRDAYHVL